MGRIGRGDCVGEREGEREELGIRQLGIGNWEELKLEEGKEWKRKELRIRQFGQLKIGIGRFTIRMRENIGYGTF